MSCTVKAEFQGEMRRFVLPKDATMDTFVAKMREIFPALEESDFNVYYRDHDGDVVRIGSTEELHHACETCGDILRLAVRALTPQTQPAPPTPTREPRSQLDLWDPSRLFSMDPFSAFESDPFFQQMGFGLHFPWEHRQLRLRQREEQLKHQREYEEKMKEVYKERQKQKEKFIREEAEKFRQEMDKRMEAAEEEGSVVKRSKSGTVVVAKPKMRTFGSWEPVSESGPGWSSTSWGPVGYELHYYYPGEAEEEKKGETKEETKEEAKEEMETK